MPGIINVQRGSGRVSGVTETPRPAALDWARLEEGGVCGRDWLGWDGHTDETSES